MVMNLQMKLKQKLGVAAVFALGIFVVIASSESANNNDTAMSASLTLIVIRAYYSHLNETMLTCTVSMVETAIAIIASCLPALRSMFIGGNTQNPTSSYGKHYELTSDRRKTNNTRSDGNTTSVMSPRRTKHTPHDSEDSLVTGDLSVESGSPSLSNGQGEKGRIHVETTIATHIVEGAETARSAV
jgi:ethanolamine utilization microcompartment shell protein EutS